MGITTKFEQKICQDSVTWFSISPKKIDDNLKMKVVTNIAFEAICK